MINSFVQTKTNEGKSAFMTGAQKASGKKAVKYSIVIILILILPTALGWLKFETLPYFFIGYQVYGFLIGIIHLWQMGKRFGWRNADSFFQKMSLSLTILLAAMILQGIIVFFCPPMKGFWLIFPTSLLFFLFPLMTISTFDFAIRIPLPFYKKWKYPENPNLPDPDSIDFSNSKILIVTFEIKKVINDQFHTQMKFKAPQDKLNFGELFLFWMTEYNERDRMNQVQFRNEVNNTYEWVFYIKSKRWWQSNKFIDPSLTVRENKIQENNIIISERV